MMEKSRQLNTIGVVLVILFQFFVSSRLSSGHIPRPSIVLTPVTNDTVPNGSQRNIHRLRSLSKHIHPPTDQTKIPRQACLDAHFQLKRGGDELDVRRRVQATRQELFCFMGGLMVSARYCSDLDVIEPGADVYNVSYHRMRVGCSPGSVTARFRSSWLWSLWHSSPTSFLRSS